MADFETVFNEIRTKGNPSGSGWQIDVTAQCQERRGDIHPEIGRVLAATLTAYDNPPRLVEELAAQMTEPDGSIIRFTSGIREDRANQRISPPHQPELPGKLRTLQGAPRRAQIDRILLIASKTLGLQ